MRYLHDAERPTLTPDSSAEDPLLLSYANLAVLYRERDERWKQGGAAQALHYTSLAAWRIIGAWAQTNSGGSTSSTSSNTSNISNISNISNSKNTSSNTSPKMGWTQMNYPREGRFTPGAATHLKTPHAGGVGVVPEGLLSADPVAHLYCSLLLQRASLLALLGRRRAALDALDELLTLLLPSVTPHYAEDAAVAGAGGSTGWGILSNFSVKSEDTISFDIPKFAFWDENSANKDGTTNTTSSSNSIHSSSSRSSSGSIFNSSTISSSNRRAMRLHLENQQQIRMLRAVALLQRGELLLTAFDAPAAAAMHLRAGIALHPCASPANGYLQLAQGATSSSGA